MELGMKHEENYENCRGSELEQERDLEVTEKECRNWVDKKSIPDSF